MTSAPAPSAAAQPSTTTSAPAPAPTSAQPSSNATTAPPAGSGGGGGGAKRTNPLVIKGPRIFDSVTGEYFGMRGINYYPRPNGGPLDVNNYDFFTSKFKHVWGRDLPQFVALNANTIRLYAVDPDGDHTEFMCALQAAGIYVVIDLASSCPGCEVTADAAPACYPASYKERGQKIINNFAKYDNVLGFSGGNEINHRTQGNLPQWNAPCQKKFIRDMRAYIRSCPEMRQIPSSSGVSNEDTEGEDVGDTETEAADEQENDEAPPSPQDPIVETVKPSRKPNATRNGTNSTGSRKPRGRQSTAPSAWSAGSATAVLVTAACVVVAMA
ncbi:hypothetical protein ATCC90586_006979 [Pythium insidiosum]|nr:hypothetical protein ATCC90586_006979 [Pythium insidiosum]